MRWKRLFLGPIARQAAPAIFKAARQSSGITSRIIIALLIWITLSIEMQSTAIAGQNDANAIADPYKDEYNKARFASYKLHRQQYNDFVKQIYFAIGCHVVRDEISMLGILQTQGSLVDEEAIRNGWIDTHGHGLFMAAAAAGHKQATEPGACNFWHEHPDLVALLRQNSQ